MRAVICADHNGVALKRRLTGWLQAAGHVVVDIGVDSDEVVDYPPLCEALCRRIAAGEADFGVVVGGSGQGEVIACNKLPGIRAGVAYSAFAAEISRANNDANVIVLGTKVSSDDEAQQLLEAWLATPFKGGEHARRVAQVMALEQRDPGWPATG